MRKHFCMLLVIAMLLTLTACGGGTQVPSGAGTTAPPSTSAADTTPTLSGGDTPDITDAPTSDIGDGTGVYEGEVDANGKFTGWGVWIYHNFRYEGYFVDGAPNGEGMLFTAVDHDDRTEEVVQGEWVDGYGNGTMTVVHVGDGFTNTWEIEIKDGGAAAGGRIEGICTGPKVDTQPVWLPISEGQYFALVPPWANISVDPSIPAPKGSGTNMPPESGPSQSQSPSTPAPSTSTPPTAAPVDISELTFNADAISLSAKLNGDGTITYTYKDTSLKPAYSCDGEVFFSIEVQGMDAETSIITDANFTPYGNDFEPLDLAGMVGLVSTGGSIPVTVDDNGLTATWQCRALGGTELENLEMFSITYTLNVGGEIVFSEWVRFGAGLVLQ